VENKAWAASEYHFILDVVFPALATRRISDRHAIKATYLRGGCQNGGIDLGTSDADQRQIT
jgi:hypothetical protein